jgi:hypothetical protein
LVRLANFEEPGGLRHQFGSPGYWMQDTGRLSVSSLGAESAESCGRDSLWNLPGLNPASFGLFAEANDLQTERICTKDSRVPQGYSASNECGFSHGSG